MSSYNSLLPVEVDRRWLPFGDNPLPWVHPEACAVKLPRLKNLGLAPTQFRRLLLKWSGKLIALGLCLRECCGLARLLRVHRRGSKQSATRRPIGRLTYSVTQSTVQTVVLLALKHSTVPDGIRLATTDDCTLGVVVKCGAGAVDGRACFTSLKGTYDTVARYMGPADNNDRSKISNQPINPAPKTTCRIVVYSD